MKKLNFLILVVVLIGAISCNQPVTENYTSVGDFYAHHKVSMQTYTINGSTGGSFTSPQGTVVIVPPNAFVTQSNVPVTGSVTIEFKDLYKKSDMLLSDKSTVTNWGYPLKSGGEFFIKASFNNSAVQMAPGKKITIRQPIALTGGDTLNLMQAFVEQPDTIGLGIGWGLSPTDSTNLATGQYIYSLYQFNTPADSGSWCNSDNSTYFSAYPQTSVTIHPNDAFSLYNTQVFLVFNDINCMIHVYDDGTNFPYNYAPQGLSCTIVGFGVKDGSLYSCFLPITIGLNQTHSFSLTPTNSADFIAALEALN